MASRAQANEEIIQKYDFLPQDGGDRKYVERMVPGYTGRVPRLESNQASCGFGLKNLIQLQTSGEFLSPVIFIDLYFAYCAQRNKKN